MNFKILVVEDDKSVSEMIALVLRNEGFQVAVVANGLHAIEAVKETSPDLVLMDLMLPGVNGIDASKEIRKFSGVPIIMLTAKGDTIDIVLGLESGADDYMIKPFKPKELIARIRARLRKEDNPGKTEVYTGNGVEINIATHKAKYNDKDLPLTPLEFDLLTTLAKNPNTVFSRELLLKEVWGYQNTNDTRLVNVHVQRLRSKLEPDPDNPIIVQTVRGVGYKFNTE